MAATPGPTPVFPVDKPPAPGPTRFGLRNITQTHSKAPVQVVRGEVPAWLRGRFYQHAGGAFEPQGGSEADLDGLAHVCMWDFGEGDEKGKGEPQVLFSNNFAPTRAFEAWVESGGAARHWPGTGAGAAGASMNPNVSYVRADGEGGGAGGGQRCSSLPSWSVAPSTPENPERVRWASLSRDGLLPLERPEAALTDLLKRDGPDGADATMSFTATHFLESPDENNLLTSFFVRPPGEGNEGVFETGYRVHRVRWRGDKRGELLHERLTGREGAGGVMWRALTGRRMTAAEAAAQPGYVHCGIETANYLIIPESSARLNPAASVAIGILARLPLVGRFWRRPFFEFFENHEAAETHMGFLLFRKVRAEGDAAVKGVEFVQRLELGATGHAWHPLQGFEVQQSEKNGNRDLLVIDTDVARAMGGSSLPAGVRPGDTEPSLRRLVFDLRSGARVEDLERELPKVEAFGQVNPLFLVTDVGARFCYEKAPGALLKVDMGKLGDGGAKTPTTTPFELAEDPALAGAAWDFGEPQFAPHPAAAVAGPDPASEDKGVLLFVGRTTGELRPEQERSYLFVVDAPTMRELARVEAKVDVNHGLHSLYLPAGCDGGARDMKWRVRF